MLNYKFDLRYKNFNAIIFKMKKIFSIVVVVINSFTIFSQEIPLQEKKKDSSTIYYLIRNDSLIQPSLELEEVVVTGNKWSKNQEDRKKFAILQRRVIKVYPYAKTAADNLLLLEKCDDVYAQSEIEEKLKKQFRLFTSKNVFDHFVGYKTILKQILF